MQEVLQELHDIGIIPVIAIDDAEKAVPLAHALVEGGLPAAEVTFRTAAGQAAIGNIARECPEILLGAGTVLNVEQCRRALDSGARFIVSPGYNDDVVNYCVGNKVPVLPGCANASDLTRAFNAGLKTVKFFPAEQAGGITYLKALAPVFPLDFVPTGGVNTKNLMDYLGFNRVAACGGTWMVKKDMIEAQRWDDIIRICKEAVSTMLGFELRHVGINCSSKEEALQVADAFGKVFHFESNVGNTSVFAGTAIECMNEPYLGEQGHIAFAVNDMSRALYHLGRRGVEFREDTRKLDDKGNTKTIYFKESIGGFAVHLVQK